MWQGELKDRLFFTAQDVAVAKGISLASAHVLCSRYVRRGEFIRLKRNFYVLAWNWEGYGDHDFLRLCNFLQVPSYVSCMSALIFHGITTQIQQYWYENTCTRRSKKLEIKGVSFLFYKVKPALYSGFVKQDGVFVAEPEKALLDAAYLESLGRHSVDWSSLDLERLNTERLAALFGLFPFPVRQRVRKKCRL